MTDADSFKRATTWYRELIEEIGKDAPIILAGNKCDIQSHTVQKEEADSFARSKGIVHMHTSAKAGENVEYIFTQLAESKFTNKPTKCMIYSQNNVIYINRDDGEKGRCSKLKSKLGCRCEYGRTWS